MGLGGATGNTGHEAAQAFFSYPEPIEATPRSPSPRRSWPVQRKTFQEATLAAVSPKRSPGRVPPKRSALGWQRSTGSCQLRKLVFILKGQCPENPAVRKGGEVNAFFTCSARSRWGRFFIPKAFLPTRSPAPRGSWETSIRRASDFAPEKAPRPSATKKRRHF